MFMSVDFPLPEAPTTATNEPFSKERFTPRRASTVTSPSWYVLQRPSTSMMGGTSRLPLPALELGVEGIGAARPRRGSAHAFEPRDHERAFGEAVFDLDAAAVRAADRDAPGLRALVAGDVDRARTAAVARRRNAGRGATLSAPPLAASAFAASALTPAAFA